MSTTWSSAASSRSSIPTPCSRTRGSRPTVAEHVFRTRGQRAGRARLARRLRRGAGRAPAAERRRGRATSSCRSSSRARTCDTLEVESLEKETKPPRRYSDASLLGAMETAGKLVDDDELREAMKDSGIGTPATRAAIIERLIDVGYVEREGRALVATEKGTERHPAARRARADLAVADRRLGAPARPDRGGRGVARARSWTTSPTFAARDRRRARREAQGRPRSRAPTSGRARSAGATSSRTARASRAGRARIRAAAS